MSDSNGTCPTCRQGDLIAISEVVRDLYRSESQPEAIVPNRVDEYSIDLHTQDYRFKRGHKIKVQVQSSWFPLIDRNPQTFVPSIFRATPGDYRKATQRIYHAPGQASFVELPLVVAR